MSLLIASYNIHRCYGRDGQYDPQRIKQVLHALNAEVIALQEVELLHDAPGLLEFFCENIPGSNNPACKSWTAIPGLTLTRDSGHYGNAILTCLPIRSVQRIDLSLPGREPRGALHVSLEYQGAPLVVIATHLGLRPAERRAQIRRLLAVLENDEAASDQAIITVLMGDLNEWFLWGRPLRWLQRYFQPGFAPASFPACCPFFALDRIWAKPRRVLGEVKVVSNKLTRVASDHLPLIARIE